MDKPAGRSKLSGVLWILVVLAVAIVWVELRPDPDPASSTETSTTLDDVDPDDILVDLDDDASPAQVAAIERELGIDLVLVSDQAADEQFYRAHVDPAEQAELIARLSGRPEVELAEPDGFASIEPLPASEPIAADDDPSRTFPNDPKYRYQWHLDQIRMPAAWRLSDGNGVVVAVLDTGVAYEDYTKYHLVPDLAGVEFVKSFNFVTNNAHANDGHGHGTHVTGTIAQATNNGIGVAGVAPKVVIMPLKVLGDNGSGSVGGIADAIRYAADNGAKVINMSLGSRFNSKALEKAVKYAHDKGVTVVCAAGNDGRGKVGFPAANPGAVAVAATQIDEKTTFYSNWGKEIDIAAPGGNTREDQNKDGMPDGVLQNTIAIGDPTRDDYFPFMGTSMASPHAAAVAALVVAQGVTKPDAVEQILEKTARKPKTGYDAKKYGAGIIDAKEAILAARASSGAWQVGIAGLLAGALAFGLRRRGLLAAGTIRTGFWAGLTVGAGGLFFLPMLAPSVSSLPVIDMLTRGLPSWDLSVLGPLGHGHAVFFSAAIPLALLALGGGLGWARAPLAGLAVGVAGHLLFHAAAGMIDVRWMVLDPLWLVANAAVCTVIGRAALLRR